jgi:hypothetical protein
MIKLGNDTYTEIYIGNTPIDAIYLGTEEIWSSTSTPTPKAHSVQYQWLDSPITNGSQEKTFILTGVSPDVRTPLYIEHTINIGGSLQLFDNYSLDKDVYKVAYSIDSSQEKVGECIDAYIRKNNNSNIAYFNFETNSYLQGGQDYTITYSIVGSQNTDLLAFIPPVYALSVPKIFYNLVETSKRAITLLTNDLEAGNISCNVIGKDIAYIDGENKYILIVDIDLTNYQGLFPCRIKLV